MSSGEFVESARDLFTTCCKKRAQICGIGAGGAAKRPMKMAVLLVDNDAQELAYYADLDSRLMDKEAFSRYINAFQLSRPTGFENYSSMTRYITQSLAQPGAPVKENKQGRKPVTHNDTFFYLRLDTEEQQLQRELFQLQHELKQRQQQQSAPALSWVAQVKAAWGAAGPCMVALDDDVFLGAAGLAPFVSQE